MAYNTTLVLRNSGVAVRIGIGFKPKTRWHHPLGLACLDQHGVYTIKYCLLYTVKELFEMLGIVLFIYALLDYIVQIRVALDFY